MASSPLHFHSCIHSSNTSEVLTTVELDVTQVSTIQAEVTQISTVNSVVTNVIVQASVPLDLL
jgi:hypothetical protein